MSAIVFYFHVHQPYRVKTYPLFDIGKDHHYFNSTKSALDNQKILNKVAHKSYLPFNQLLLNLLKQYPQLKLSFSISGVVLDQFTHFKPEVLDSFKRLVDTGRVELVNETYYHSLCFLFSDSEFVRQIKKHKQALKSIFGYTPTAFRNTELIYNNDIAKKIESMGYKTILAEGVDRYLNGRSPNFVYKPPNTKKIRVLLKNYKLSDDIAFRFSNRGWNEWPLTAEKYAHWLSSINSNGQVINLFMDYETFGEHQWQETGIFQFMQHLPEMINRHVDNKYMTISEASQAFDPVDTIDMPDLTSWADLERDLSAWRSNPLQEAALQSLYSFENDVISSGDDQLIEDWRKLTTSDHFYYMCTKWFADGDVHKYFSPNNSPYEAYQNFMTILHDLRLRVYANRERRFTHV